MRKVFAILTATAMLLSFAACGAKNDVADDGNVSEAAESTQSAELSQIPDDAQANPEDFPGGLAEDGAEVLKTVGVDFTISLIEPATYWKQDVSTMDYNNDYDDDTGITIWAKDSSDDNSTVCIQQIKDQTYKGTALERTNADEFADKTFETAQVGDYTLYHAKARENADGYKEEHMFVDFNGCTLSFFGCYYDFSNFCDFLEATLGHIQVEKNT